MSEWLINSKLLFAMLFLSGFAALVYELLWVRILGFMFGVSSFAIATAVSVFLLGLGIGSLLFGKFGERSKNVIKVYAYLELWIAIASLLSYMLLRHVPYLVSIYSFFYNTSSFYQLSLVRLLICSIILLPPSILIGGTLPLISKYLINRNITLGSRFCTIYSMNTLGAFFGTLFTALLLMRYLGLRNTFFTAVLLNILIFFLVSLLAKDTPSATADKETLAKSPKAESHHTQSARLLFFILFFIIGFLGIAFQVLWTRIMSVYYMSSTTSYAFILSGFLLGIVLGAYLVSFFIDRIDSPLRHISLYLIIVSFLASQLLYVFSNMTSIILSLAGLFNIPAFLPNLSIISSLLGFLFSFVIALFLGALFPLAFRRYSPDVGRIADSIGKTYFYDSLGAVFGSIIAGFLLIPFLGFTKSTSLLLGICFLLSALLLFIEVYTKLSSSKSISAYLSKLFSGKNFIIVLLLLVISPTSFFIVANNKAHLFMGPQQEFLYYSEGLTATVSVVDISLKGRQEKALCIDSQNVAGTSAIDVIDSKMLAHLPLLLHKKPDSAVTVGYGTGGTSYSMLLHGVEVYAVEIEPKVIEADSNFSELNHDARKNPRMHVVIDDARNYLYATDRKFDVIVTDVTNLKYKGNPSLYSEEYFEIMKSRLNKDGIAAAWVPLSALSFGELQILISTFNEVYPHTTIWFFTKYPTHFVILIGTPEKLDISLDTLEARMTSNPEIEQNLKSIEVDNVYELATMLLLGEEDVHTLVSGIPQNTDNNALLEFSNMGFTVHSSVPENLKKLLSYKRENLVSYFQGNQSRKNTLSLHYQDLARLHERSLR